MNKEIKPKILSSKQFTRETFKIRNVKSSLVVNENLQSNIDKNWKNFLDEAHKKGVQPWDGTYYRLENKKSIEKGEFYFSTIKYSQIRGLTHNVDLSTIPTESQPISCFYRFINQDYR